MPTLACRSGHFSFQGNVLSNESFKLRLNESDIVKGILLAGGTGAYSGEVEQPFRPT